MAAKKKKIHASGKFKVGYGVRLRKSYNAVESLQRQKQASPFHPTGKVKRIAAGIWQCIRTGKVFAGPAYSLKPKTH